MNPTQTQNQAPQFDGSALGPRQLTLVQKAIRDFRWNASMQHEVNGIIEQPETHEWHSYVSLYGGVAHPRTADMWAAIVASYRVLTPANYKQAVDALMAGAKELLADKAPMTVDKRKPLEQVQGEQERARIAAEELGRKARERDEARTAAWASIDAKRPSWAKAIIVAELREDASDPYSDYYNHNVRRSVAIGWRSGSREDFRQLRAAAAQFPETVHLGPDAGPEVEHRDNYSMGAGNWVGISKYSGWVVKSHELASRYTRDMVLEDSLPELMPESSPDAGVEAPGRITVQENKAKGGVEIRFAEKPSADVIAHLKANGWRWTRFGGCWYKSATDTARRFAYEVAGLPYPGDTRDEGLAAMTDLDRQFEDACAQACGD